MRSRTFLAATASLVLLLAPATPALAGNSGVVVARYGFDGGAWAFDSSGRGHDLRVVTSGGGALRRIAHGRGRAVQFPSKCGRTRAVCPHAVLQSRNSGALNPGVRNLAYGATIKLARSQTSMGQNVLQKGYSKRNSQYKLQIDGGAGRPSCVVVGVTPRTIYRASSRLPVADNRWHDVSCRRSGALLTIIVDGQVRGARRIPTRLAIVNQQPLSIGGKGAYRDNDQFQGAIDDVWVRISS